MRHPLTTPERVAPVASDPPTAADLARFAPIALRPVAVAGPLVPLDLGDPFVPFGPLVLFVLFVLFPTTTAEQSFRPS